MIHNFDDTSKPRLSLDHATGDWGVIMADGRVIACRDYAEATYAVEHNGDLPRPVDMSGFTPAQRRAAYLRATAPSAATRNPLTGHFTGGDRGQR